MNGTYACRRLLSVSEYCIYGCALLLVLVHVGGLTKWKSEERPVETGAPAAPPASTGYTATPRPELVVSWEQVLAELHSESQIADARGAGRFHAKDPEPRPGMRGGHIPGAVNVPFAKLVSPADYSVRAAKHGRREWFGSF